MHRKTCQFLIGMCSVLASMSATATAEDSDCGKLSFSGHIEKHGEQYRLMIFKGSASETRIILSIDNFVGWRGQVGLYSSGRLLIHEANGSYYRSGRVLQSEVAAPDPLGKNGGDWLESIREAECEEES